MEQAGIKARWNRRKGKNRKIEILCEFCASVEFRDCTQTTRRIPKREHVLKNNLMRRRKVEAAATGAESPTWATHGICEEENLQQPPYQLLSCGKHPFDDCSQRRNVRPQHLIVGQAQSVVHGGAALTATAAAAASHFSLVCCFQFCSPYGVHGMRSTMEMLLLTFSWNRPARLDE